MKQLKPRFPPLMRIDGPARRLFGSQCGGTGMPVH